MSADFEVSSNGLKSFKSRICYTHNFWKFRHFCVKNKYYWVMKDETGSKSRGRRHGGHKKDKTKLQRKIVIRHLPPTMTEEEFLKQIDPLPENDFYYFAAADWSLGFDATCRAYITLKNYDDVFLFRDRFDGYVFVDSKGAEYPAIVEFAPFQGLLKNKSRRGDNKVNTIEEESHYQQFLAKLTEERELAAKGGECKMEFILDRKEEKITSTPLLQYLAHKKEKRREEAKKRTEEKRRQRDDDKEKRRQQQIVLQQQVQQRQQYQQQQQKQQTITKIMPSRDSSGKENGNKLDSSNSLGSLQDEGKSVRNQRRTERNNRRREEYLQRKREKRDRKRDSSSNIHIRKNENSTTENQTTKKTEDNKQLKDGRVRDRDRNRRDRRDRERKREEQRDHEKKGNNRENNKDDKPKAETNLKITKQDDEICASVRDFINSVANAQDVTVKTSEESIQSISSNKESFNKKSSNDDTDADVSKNKEANNDCRQTQLQRQRSTEEQRRIRNKDRPSIAIYQPKARLRLSEEPDSQQMPRETRSTVTSDNESNKKDEVRVKKVSRYSERRGERRGSNQEKNKGPEGDGVTEELNVNIDNEQRRHKIRKSKSCEDSSIEKNAQRQQKNGTTSEN